VHTMLRLPVPNYRLRAGCNFAITHVLTTAIGGHAVDGKAEAFLASRL